MVDCSAIQAALSARLDGEPPGLDEAIIDAHLTHCEQCRDFYNRAAELNRQLNFCAVEPRTLVPPDLSEIILAEVEPQWRRRANTRVLAVALSRIALVVLGVIYAVWAIVLLGDTAQVAVQEDPLTARLITEAATFRLGLSAALFFAAWRPKSISGILPLFGVLWTFNLGFAARDLIIGETGGTTGNWILLLFVSTVVLLIAWANSFGTGVLHRTWSSLKATPT